MGVLVTTTAGNQYIMGSLQRGVEQCNTLALPFWNFCKIVQQSWLLTTITALFIPLGTVSLNKDTIQVLWTHTISPNSTSYSQYFMKIILRSGPTPQVARLAAHNICISGPVNCELSRTSAFHRELSDTNTHACTFLCWAKRWRRFRAFCPRSPCRKMDELSDVCFIQALFLGSSAEGV